MKMNAPERNSFFRNKGEPCNTQYIVVACSFLYIIQFISHFFKGKIAVLSFLNMRNDDLHNIFRLSLCIIFLIFLVLELLWNFLTGTISKCHKNSFLFPSHFVVVYCSNYGDILHSIFNYPHKYWLFRRFIRRLRHSSHFGGRLIKLPFAVQTCAFSYGFWRALFCFWDSRLLQKNFSSNFEHSFAFSEKIRYNRIRKSFPTAFRELPRPEAPLHLYSKR